MGIWLTRSSDTNGVGYKSPQLLNTLLASSTLLATFESDDTFASKLYEYREKNIHLVLLYYGTVDNASIGEYGFNTASIICNTYLEEGSEGFSRLHGTGAFALYDFRSDRVVLHRSLFGGFPLYFFQGSQGFSACSNPLPIAYRYKLTGAIDDEAVANLFSLRPLHFKGCFFKGMKLLEQGETVIVSREGKIVRKAPKLDFHRRSTQEDKKAAESYGALLESRISRYLAPESRYGIMLSSGMDSGTLAYFASKHLRRYDGTLHAISWELPGDPADESVKIRELARHLGISLELFNGESFGPFDNLDSIKPLADAPLLNPFWALTHESYRRFADAEVRSVLTGTFGDLLFRDDRHALLGDILRHGRTDLLAALLREGGVKALASELKRTLHGFKTAAADRPWFTPSAQSYAGQTPPFVAKGVPRQYAPALSPLFSNYRGWERHLYLPVGLERIEPYQDSELINETLEMPLYMLYRHGMKKYVLREAMQNRLPDSIRLQPRTGIMKGLVERSFMRNVDAVHAMIWENRLEWEPYIDSAWMYRKMQPDAVREHIDYHVIWICITLTAWKRAFATNGRFYKQFAAIDGSG